MISGLGPTVLAVTWSDFAAGSVLMVLRIYTNGFIIRRWNPDFWWASASYVSVENVCPHLSFSDLVDLCGSLLSLPHYRCLQWHRVSFLPGFRLESRTPLTAVPIDLHNMFHPCHCFWQNGSHSIYPATGRDEPNSEIHFVFLSHSKLLRQLSVHTPTMG